MKRSVSFIFIGLLLISFLFSAMGVVSAELTSEEQKFDVNKDGVLNDTELAQFEKFVGEQESERESSSLGEKFSSAYGSLKTKTSSFFGESVSFAGNLLGFKEDYWFGEKGWRSLSISWIFIWFLILLAVFALLYFLLVKFGLKDYLPSFFIFSLIGFILLIALFFIFLLFIQFEEGAILFNFRTAFLAGLIIVGVKSAFGFFDGSIKKGKFWVENLLGYLILFPIVYASIFVIPLLNRVVEIVLFYHFTNFFFKVLILVILIGVIPLWRKAKQDQEKEEKAINKLRETAVGLATLRMMGRR